MIYVSENVEAMFGFPAADLFGKPLKTIFDEEQAVNWERQLQRELNDTKPLYVFFTVGIRGVERTFDVIAHRY